VDLQKLLASAEEAATKPKYVLQSVDALEEEIRSALLKMIERGGKSSGQLRKQLVEKEYPAELIDSLLTRFTEVGLVDDFALAKEHARVLFERKGKSKTLIGMELREKGFPQDAIKDALTEIESDDELELAKEIALAKMAKTSATDKSSLERKVAGFLARKGYPSSVVWSAVRYASEQLSR
jgi:regulatory protein